MDNEENTADELEINDDLINDNDIFFGEDEI